MIYPGTIETYKLRNVPYYLSEIEQLIISGLYRVFAEDREMDNSDIVNEIKETVPLSITYKEHINQLRASAKNRARPAT